MTFIEWLPLALVCLLGAATPGPSLAVIINLTFQNGRATGVMASISHAFGVALYAFGAVLGLNSLFINYPIIAKWMIILGGLYLAYLGFKLLTSPIAAAQKPQQQITSDQSIAWSGVRDAFLIAFLNPKLAIFFIALFSQFIPAEGVSAIQGVVLISTVFVIDMLWYVMVVQLLSLVQTKFNSSDKNVFWLTRIQGLLFVILAFNALIFSN